MNSVGIERCREGRDAYDEIVEFANYVFSYSHRPHDFKQLIPKAYGEHGRMWSLHFSVRENGRIRALAGLLPIDMHIGDAQLKLGLVGTVSVHPYARGRGFMKDCMARTMAYAREAGMDMLVLTGLRQRYGYYGFASGGSGYRFNITRTNCRHALCHANANDIEFSGATQYMPELRKMHAEYIARCARPAESFADICATWKNRLLAIVRGGEVLGYAIVSEAGDRIYELRLKDPALFDAVIAAYFVSYRGEEIELRLPPYSAAYMRAAARIAEASAIGDTCLLKVLNIPRTVEALLRLKQRIVGKLPDGKLKIGIEEADGSEVRVLKIEVVGDRVICAYTADKPDVVLPYADVLDLMFASVSHVDRDRLPLCASAYFPLPFYIEYPDLF